MTDRTRDLAREGEDLAAAWLVERGFTIIDRNYRYGRGEIDIIARDGEYTVFIEVKTRGNKNFGPAAAAVLPTKQRQIIRVARGYLFDRQLNSTPCRFDVVAVEIRGRIQNIEHFPHAFIEMP